MKEKTNERNALAELAERLDKGRWNLDVKDYDKAARIISELAKVEDKRDGETNSDALWRCNDCIAMCRVIAEEGVEYDK